MRSHKFFKTNFCKFTTISVSGGCALYSKLVKSLQAQVWSVNFTNFQNSIFGGFLQFGSAVRQPAVLFSCCAFNCEEEENGHLAPISVLKYLQTGNHLYFLIHFCFSSLLLKWKVSSPFCYFLVYFCTYLFVNMNCETAWFCHCDSESFKNTSVLLCQLF